MPRPRKRAYLFFNELSKKSKRRAINDNWDINVDEDWWDSVYEDAKMIELHITSFDDYKAIGILQCTVVECCNHILANHGKDCETYKLAEEYKPLMIADQCAWRCMEEKPWWTDEYEENPNLAEEFTQALLRLYKDMLEEERTYKTSDEAIAEALEQEQFGNYEWHVFHLDGSDYVPKPRRKEKNKCE